MTPQELAELSLAVARAEGYSYMDMHEGISLQGTYPKLYRPYSDPAEILRLVEKYGLSLHPAFLDDVFVWAVYRSAQVPGLGSSFGPTIGIAVCRAVVAIAEAKHKEKPE